MTLIRRAPSGIIYQGLHAHTKELEAPNIGFGAPLLRAGIGSVFSRFVGAILAHRRIPPPRAIGRAGHQLFAPPATQKPAIYQAFKLTGARVSESTERWPRAKDGR